jgi:hypothetical protein
VPNSAKYSVKSQEEKRMSTEMEKVILATQEDRQQTPPSEDPKIRKQKDRRAWLKKGLVGTIATAGAALLGTRAGVAQAQPNVKVGVKGIGDDIGVEGISANGVGVGGYSSEFAGVVGYSPVAIGVVASSRNGLYALQIEGGIRLVGNAIGFPVGSGFVVQGAASVPFSNPFVEPSSIVLLTPKSDPGGPLWVTGITQGSFVVNRSGPLPAFNFAYLVITLGKNTIGPKVPW